MVLCDCQRIKETEKGTYEALEARSLLEEALGIAMLLKGGVLLEEPLFKANIK